MHMMLLFPNLLNMSDTNLKYLCLGAVDDFTTVAGSVSQYAASFGNSWKVPDQQNEVMH